MKQPEPGTRAVRCAVVTLSDTRTAADDAGGALLCDALLAAGYSVVDRTILRDEPVLLRAHVESLAAAGAVDAVLTTGGTGLSARDSTFEALSTLLEKRLDGFGELFRMLSFAEIGAAAMLSRATAGTYRGLAIFALPGSPAAVRLAMERLIVPQLAHVVSLLRGETAHPHGHAHHHEHRLRAAAGMPPPAGDVRPMPVGTIAKVAEAIRYAPDKMQKHNLCASPQLFCDVYSLLPGQAQKPHLHEDADKIYYVLEGEGRFVLGDGEHTARAGEVVHAPAGVVHGVANPGPHALALLVVMAPNPIPA